MKLDRRSVILLLLQLAIVSSIAAKYLYQRQHCPRVWTRAVAYDPELVLRGRYLSMQLYVDACGVSQPPNPSRVASPLPLHFNANGNLVDTDRYLDATLRTHDGHLVVKDFANTVPVEGSQTVRVPVATANCANAVLQQPVDFYIPEQAKSPFPLPAGKYLWVEVTVPPKGPPRPLNLALNDNGRWQPLHF